MPSPFPGMDPYLEGDNWTSFHTHFATEIARQLTPKLRPKYVALPRPRPYLSRVLRPTGPPNACEMRKSEGDMESMVDWKMSIHFPEIADNFLFVRLFS